MEGGGHCLICYSLIPNANIFNSTKNPQNICISFCKLLQLPVEAFKDILNGPPACQECTKSLQEGAEVIKRFEVLRREINQLRAAFENKIVRTHKLSLDLKDLKGYKERSSIIKELNLNVNSFQVQPAGIKDKFLLESLDHELPQKDPPPLNDNNSNELGPVQMSPKELAFHPKMKKLLALKGFGFVVKFKKGNCASCPRTHRKNSRNGCGICEKPVCKDHEMVQRFCPECVRSEFGELPPSVPFDIQESQSNLTMEEPITGIPANEDDTFEDFGHDEDPEDDPMDFLNAVEDAAKVENDIKEIISPPQPNRIELRSRDLRVAPSIDEIEQMSQVKPSLPPPAPKVKGFRKSRHWPPKHSDGRWRHRDNRVYLKIPLLKLNKLDLPQGVTRVENVHDLHLPQVNSAPSSNFKLEYFCLICSQHFKQRPHLSLHQCHYDHSLKIYKCCSKIFPTLNNLVAHKRTVHEKPSKRYKKFKAKRRCPECSGYYTRLEAHIKFVHKKLRPFVCTWEGCTFAYADIRQVKKHITRDHEKILPFLCETCAKCYASRDALNNHKKRVHEPKNPGSFMCDQCSKIFPFKVNLRNHIKNVHEHEHILCTICGFELKHQHQYKDHLKWHEIKGDKFRPRNRSCWKKPKKDPSVKPKVD